MIGLREVRGRCDQGVLEIQTPSCRLVGGGDREEWVAQVRQDRDRAHVL
jgi:hypothetical protein